MVDIAFLIGIVTAITEVIKKLDYIPNKFIPLISLILAVGACYFYTEGNTSMRILNGILVGLSACGLYDQTKLITKKVTK